MLDLQARIDFEEVEVVALDEKLHGAGDGIMRRAREFQRRVDDFRAHLARKSGCGRLLDNLLITPLDGAFTLAESGHGAVIVAENLYFDVARIREIFFDE